MKYHKNFIFRLIIVLTFIVYGCSANKVKTATNIDMIPAPPDIVRRAFEDLFATTPVSEKTKTAKNEISSLWFEKSFNHSNDRFHAVFFKSQFINDKGEIAECHTCEVNISQATYKFTASGWILLSKDRNPFRHGAWGDVISNQIEIINISNEILTFGIPTSYFMMGILVEGINLLEFTNNSWRDIGHIHLLSENNDVEPIWGYKGKLSIIENTNNLYSKYSDILVTVTGTVKYANSVKVVPAKNVIYRFNGSKYLCKECQDEDV
jgi:hypothetical protein